MKIKVRSEHLSTGESSNQNQGRSIRVLTAVNRFELSSCPSLSMDVAQNHRSRRHMPLSHPERIGYRDLKLWRREESRARRDNASRMRCPCNRCKGSRTVKIQTARKHQLDYGRFYLTRVWRDQDDWDSSDAEWEQQHLVDRAQFSMEPRPIVEPRLLDPPVIVTEELDQGLDITRMIHEAFNSIDDMREGFRVHFNEGGGDEGDLPFESGETYAFTMPEAGLDSADSDALMKEACRVLYKGAKLTKIGFTMMFLNICGVHGCPNIVVDELLTFLAKSVLPEGNIVPTSHRQAKTLITKLGLNYSNIHACPAGCILFRGEYSEMTTCIKCGKDRYEKVGKSMRPLKVLRHFPLIPRLQRLYRCKSIAELMSWSVNNKSTDGMVRHTSDCKQWEHIDNMWPDFAREGRNVRLGLALDGVNPFSDKSTNWSTWPVILLNYNLPPWLVTKKFFILLALIIPGKESVTGSNVDTYLAPLVEELIQLWDGVQAFDVSADQGRRTFLLRAIVMWTVNDYPALGTISGQSTYGKIGCVCCGPRRECEYSTALHKPLYRGHRRYLPANHSYRRRRYAIHFNRRVEEGGPPARVTSAEVIDWAAMKQEFDDAGGQDGGLGDPAKETGVKRLSILYTLPYWKDLLIRHLLDVMHCEKNVSVNLLKTIFGEKDTVKVRRDLQHRNLKPHLWLQPHPRNPQVMVKPKAMYVLSKDEQSIFISRVQKLKVPTGYSAQWKKHILKKKLGHMKSHDYHLLLQQILPVCMRGLMSSDVSMTIMRLARVYRRLCVKVWDPSEYDSLKEDVVVTMCLLEMHFPPSFFDVMTHLLVHLVEELQLAGPVGTRWMYPVERYLGFLKRQVRSRARPEGGMAEGYILQEALGFTTEYMQAFSSVRSRVWDAEEEEGIAGEVLEGKSTHSRLTFQERAQLHDYVLLNTACMAPWIRKYEEWKRQSLENGNTPLSEWIKNTVKLIPEEHEDFKLELVNLSAPPSFNYLSYKKMKAYGNHFRVEDDESLGYQTYDSGVASVFIQEQSDNNMRRRKYSYVGVLEEILCIDYGHMEVPIILMRCKWVISDWDSHRPTMKIDAHGFMLANFSRTLPRNEQPYVFPSQVEQVFFADAEDLPGWKIVLRKEARSRRVVEEADIDHWEDGDCVGLQAPTTLATQLPPVSLIDVVPLSREETMLASMDLQGGQDVVEDDESDNSSVDSDEGE